MPTDQSAADNEKLIQPPRKYIIDPESDVWRDWRRNLYLIGYLAKRHLIARYRGSALGFIWSFLNPMMMMLVYTFVFKYLFNAHSAEVPYPIFFLTGIFAWHCFSIGTLNAASSVVEGAFLYKKAYFPKIAIPLGAIVSNTINYLIVIPLLIVFILIGGVEMNANFFYLPLGILLLFLWTTAVGLFLAILAPGFRDVIQLSEIFLQVWFFLTPILYPMSLPEAKLADTMGGWGLFLYKLNPMVGIIRFMQSIFLGLPMPGNTIIISCISTIALLILSVTVFLRAQNTISERV